MRIDGVGSACDFLGIDTRFGDAANKDLELFQQKKNEILEDKSFEEIEFTNLAKHLAEQSLELRTIIQYEIRQLNRIKGLNIQL